MFKKKLILIPSEHMDNNTNRDEHKLIRMSASARSYCDNQQSIELHPETTDVNKLLNGATLLKVFKAYTKDIKALENLKLTEEEKERVGFVTTAMYKHITTGSRARMNKSTWVTDSISESVIGADPEFMLFNKEGVIVRASSVLGKAGKLGSDGPMAEIRPDPAIGADDLVMNMEKLFKDEKLTEVIKDLTWKGGCYFKDSNRDYAIGGHIHIGNPIRIAKMPDKKRINFFKSFNKILDELLAIPMIKIDGAELGKGRRTNGIYKYGFFGEFRTCQGRLEHRTLSGMWLLHPELAKQVLGTAKAIIDEVYKAVSENKFDPEYMFPKSMEDKCVWDSKFKGWKDIKLIQDLNCTADSEYMVNRLHNSDSTKITKAFLTSWRNRMKDLTTYKKYAVYIDGLYETLKNNNVTTFKNYNKTLQDTWVNGDKFLE